MKKKLHITLSEEEFQILNEMNKYFSEVFEKLKIKDVKLSYSWIIGSAIRECNKIYFKKK